MSREAAIDHADQLWWSLLKDYPFLADKQEVHEKRKQLRGKEVVISAFGRHNCGKSTLLNTLLRNSCLPTAHENETSIEVKIKHDDSVHPGPCGEACCANNHKNCPRLVLEVTDNEKRMVASGADNIDESLHTENRQWRQTGMRNGTEHVSKSYILYAHIPILREAAQGWTLVLVDTPGFGEANVDHITALADRRFSTSTAYLYIMDGTSMCDELDRRKIHQLFKNDKDLFKDGRFVVAITKYDSPFSQENQRQKARKSARSARRNQLKESPTDSVQSLQQKTLKFVADTVQSDPPSNDAIVPVSAFWADTARWLKKDPPDQADIAEARRILDLYPDPQPRGQGEAAMSPVDMASSLERISGILSLERRLKSMIEHCIHIWETSLAKSYTGYLEELKTALEKHQQERVKERKEIETMLAQHAKYDARKAELTDQAFVEEGKKADIEVKLEEKYAEIDKNAAKRLLHGRIDEMMEVFTVGMKRRVEGTQTPLIQQQFEREVETFIEKKVQPGLSDEQLNIKLEGVMAEFRNSLEDMEDLDREIEQIALDVLPEGWSPAHHELPKDRKKKYDKDILSDQVLQKRQLTLKDLETKAPPLKIGIFQRVLDRIRKFFHIKVLPDSERPYTKWTREMDEAMKDLKDGLITQVDAYISDTLQQWVICEVVSVAYRNRIKSRAQALLGTYDSAVREARSMLENRHNNCAKDDYLLTLSKDLQRISTSQESLII